MLQARIMRACFFVIIDVNQMHLYLCCTLESRHG